MALTIGVDIGGTKVLGGVVDPDGTVIATSRRDTPAGDVAATRDVIIDVVKDLSTEHRVDAVGIGAAGWIDATRSTVLFAPNLAWRDEPLRDYVAKAVNLPVVVENDANVAAWAEFRYGAAADAEDSMVMFTVGTGIGGGIVLGGGLVRGAHGIAAEIGHMLAVPDGHVCGCGRHGCIEQYASGNALVRFARAGAQAEPERAKLLLDKAEGKVENITGPIVTSAAQAGDEIAIDAFGQIGYWLGQGLADLVQILDPQVLVVGGGVIDAGDLLMTPARQSYLDSLAQRGRLPVAELRAAKMGNTAGLIGAADLARQ
ncbi:MULTISPECIES: ROK family glucokinase [Catellatospora]|uniref:Glucokinase n=1 Tax=Catellatospora bangladeshensis TaxID=310355 RepID=A0A8J3NF13_9ACTN|nr:MULTISPECIES: ROK family glucokinase [Catellatospora]BCJ77886.1 glucokinase [Catellatospora sp. IY07-71]GIF78970.1 glucokinase [Catellatospora bangladeshensis]